MLNLKVLNGASPPADLKVSAPPFPNQNGRHPLPVTRAALPGGDCRGRAGAADSPLPGAGRARAQPGTPRHVTAWAGAPRETGRPGMGGVQKKIGKGGLGWDAKWHRFGKEESNRSHVTALQGPAQAVGPAQVLQYRCIHPPTHGVEDWPVFESPARDPWPRGSGLKLQLPQAVASRTDPVGRPHDFLFLP